MAFSNHDIVSDSPTNNFATLNANNKPIIATLSNGNLNFTGGTTNNGNTTATLEVSSGKYYCEMVPTTSYSAIGVTASSTLIKTNNSNNGGLPNTISTYQLNYDGNVVDSSGIVDEFLLDQFEAYTTSNIIGVLLDMDNRQVSWYKDGTILGTVGGLLDLNHTFFAADTTGGSSGASILNFGQDPTFGGAKSPSTTYPDSEGYGSFYYDPTQIASDVKALCTANLPDFTPTVIDDTPQDYFNTFLYDASGSSLQQFAHGFTFTPDFLWIKNRSSSSGSHWIYDRVRGFTNYDLTAGKGLSTTSSAAEGGDVTLGAIIEPRPTETYDIETHITIRDGNGADVDTYNVNFPGHKYVVWGFRAGGAPQADNSNTSGSGAMTPDSVSLNGTLQSNYTPAGSPTIYPKRMSINTDAGFSIVQWTGNGAALVDNTYQSIPTGLSGQLAFAIQKRTNATGNWHTYHKNCSVAHTYWSAHLYLNNTLVEQIGSGYDSQVFKYTHSNGLCEFQNGDSNNVSGGEYISYFFEEVEGFSKFGSYIGNGSATGDGPFVYTGFRPAWIMIKNISISENFTIRDSARTPYNPNQLALYSNLTNGDDVACPEIDFFSNGFKLRANQTNLNQSNGTDSNGTGYNYIFIAFAEQPFKYANAR